MNSLENRAGFNISSSKLQVVEINFESGQFELENVDEAYFNEPLNLENDKETKIASVLQGAFDELLVRKPLKSNLLLRRDSRIKERRKYGLKKARKASQYSKR